MNSIVTATRQPKMSKQWVLLIYVCYERSNETLALLLERITNSNTAASAEVLFTISEIQSIMKIIVHKCEIQLHILYICM